MGREEGVSEFARGTCTCIITIGDEAMGVFRFSFLPVMK
jgi:hypothetical protein